MASWEQGRRTEELGRGKGKFKFHLPRLEDWWEGRNLWKDERLQSRKWLGNRVFKKRVAGQIIKSQDLFTRRCWVKAWPWATNHLITRLEGILRGHLVHTPTIQQDISTIPNRWEYPTLNEKLWHQMSRYWLLWPQLSPTGRKTISGISFEPELKLRENNKQLGFSWKQ